MTYRMYSSIKTTGFQYSYLNASGITINKGVPVKVTHAGDMDFVNVSLEDDVFALGGVTSASGATGTKIPVVTDGRVEDIGTSFAFGDAVYIDKTGNMTNIRPEVGINGFLTGDWCVRVGTIGKNENNPSAQDIILELNVVGQL